MDDATRLTLDIATARQRLAAALDRLSHLLEHSAQLAEEHAARRYPNVDEAARRVELERAQKAWTDSRRARATADRLRDRT